MWPALIAVLLQPAADVSPVVAMILTVKGEAKLRHGDKSSRAGAMELLRRGDRLTVARDGEVRVVILDDGAVERLKGGAEVTLGDRGCRPDTHVERIKAKKLPEKNLKSLRETVRSERGAVGVLRGEAPPNPQVVSPLYGAAVAPEGLAFTWPAAKGATGYRAELLSGDGKKSLWKVEAREPKLAYPEKQAALKPGPKYHWRVFALSEGKPREIVHSEFFVLTRSEVKELAAVAELAKSKDPADQLLAAVSYEVRGVYGEALALYAKLAADSPDEPNFQQALANYYDRAGRKDRAEVARKKAEKLRKK